MPRVQKRAILPLIRRALAEDRARRDITSATVLPRSVRIRAAIVARQAGVLAGGEAAAWTFTALDPSLTCRLVLHDGRPVRAGQQVLRIEGRARSIFAAERTALNLLGHLSGIATLTAAFVRRVHGTRARILDTRKTLPGLRELEKYAVRCGGGQNHRSDLAEAVLIKTNHVRALSTQHTAHSEIVQAAIKKSRSVKPRKFIEVEVTNLREFQAALAARPDAILLDNWPLAAIRQAVRMRGRRRRLLLEVSGGVTLANVREIARTGVDRISIGRLTHSAPWLDVSLKVM